ncbi:MAG: flagellar basal-body rod protein FlgF [Rhodocyclaceae bacterium]|jgi:flagellar basal-body rod protein FlgF|nr:flagellar basal-body rod protein FlgF [Rhodocyclaceae bacterium]
MDKLIYTAMTGASATLGRQAAVAHNLANVTTHGYRAEEHRLRAAQVQTHNNMPAALPTRAFAVDASTHSDFSEGALMHTGGTYDIALKGRGWIALALPDGSEAYTRNGGFEISENGVMQTRGGIPVQGDGGPITIPPDSRVTIERDGTISVTAAGGAQNTVTVVGRIKLVNPPEADLKRGPDGLFRLNTGDAAPLDEGVKVAAGYLENSNVNPVEQMVAMISLARQFEMQIKLLTNAEMNDRAATQVLAQR